MTNASLSDKHVVISGGGSGVGAEIARRCSAAGAQVTILGRSLPSLQAIADETGAAPLTCDVTDQQAVATALARATEHYGAISVAVANAGAADSMPFSKMTADSFNQAIAVNLNGVFHLWQAALPSMKKLQWGRLIAIASTAGLKGYPYVSAYCAAKHGVVGLTRSLAIELGASGVTANAICPGFIETPLLERSIEKITHQTGLTADEAARSLLAANPQQRFITTAEVAASVLYLCSDEAASMNGHTLTLSGGEI
jgi:NAD(P)-dependent dehydrogenase (short-subunit alcohol dehydrogenase family)